MKNQFKIFFSIILLVSLSIVFQINNSFADLDSYESEINAIYNKSLWKLGENLNQNDFFSYRICDDTVPLTYILESCYTIDLEFLALMKSEQGPVWIVQGILTADEKEIFVILHMDAALFTVKSDSANTDLANSLEKTIFALSDYEKKPLKIGSIWDTLDSYFTHSVSLEIKKIESIKFEFGDVQAYALGYDVIIPSYHYIQQDFPFPVSADLHSANIIFPEPLELYSYKLLHYSFFDAETNQIVDSICYSNLVDDDFIAEFDDLFNNSTTGLEIPAVDNFEDFFSIENFTLQEEEEYP